MSKFWFAFVLFILPSAYAMDFSAQISPFAVGPTGGSALGISVGVERFFPDQAIINYANLGVLGAWTGGKNSTSLSTAYLFHMGSDLYLGGRVGIANLEKSSALNLGYGAIAFRSQPKDSRGFYEVDLGLTGASYAVASYGLRF